MAVNPNTTIVDLSFNLSGSLTGIPTVMAQMPVYDRIGFDDMPYPWEDTDRLDQTWTPDVAGSDLTFTVPVYNVQGQAKQPYTTDLFTLQNVIVFGNGWVHNLLVPNTGIPAFDVPVGYNLRGKIMVVTRNNLFPPSYTESYGLITEDFKQIVFAGTGTLGFDVPTVAHMAIRGDDAGFDITTLWDETSGAWQLDAIQFPDDQDYIVADNTLPIADKGYWGFHFTFII